MSPPNELAWVIDAAKVGAIGLAGAVLAYTAKMLTDELRRPTVRRSARTLIYAFMGFSLLPLLVAAGLEWWKMNNEKADAVKIGAMQTQVKAIDNALNGKIKNEITGIGDSDKRDHLFTFTDDICDGVKQLANLVNMTVKECMSPPRITPPR
jgi:hypothetical protein